MGLAERIQPEHWFSNVSPGRMRLVGSDALTTPEFAPQTRILYLSHYFPPEGNAPAARVHAMCKRWVRDGHQVTVITCAPNHPNGTVYPGYHNWPLQQEFIDGIRVLRVGTFLAANKGRWRRVMNFISYMVTATLTALYVRRPDVLIATSPQFFCGWAGVLVASLKRIPFILEVRDLWPESIRAVGAARHKLPLWVLEKMEQQMYATAYRIVTVGPGYKQKLIERRVPDWKVQIVTNGVDQQLFNPHIDGDVIRRRFGLEGKFVCSYVGTIGMASGLDVTIRAAKLLKEKGRSDVRILLVGDGATCDDLRQFARQQGLDNLIFTGRVDRRMVPRFIAASDACLVHLHKRELFESVLPSKMFEAAGMARPIILGVQGSAANLLRQAKAGLCIEPENEHELVAAIEKLAGDKDMAASLGRCGYDFVRRYYDRDKLSRDYFGIIRNTIETCPIAA